MRPMEPAGSYDGRSPEGVMSALYACLCGPASVPRDWRRFRALFRNDARLCLAYTAPDGSTQIRRWTVEQFIEQATEWYAIDGFWEKAVWERIDRFGSIAHAWSSYASRRGRPESDPFGRGINSVQLIHENGEWKIASLCYDLESDHNPIPPSYLPPQR